MYKSGETEPCIITLVIIIQHQNYITVTLIHQNQSEKTNSTLNGQFIDLFYFNKLVLTSWELNLLCSRFVCFSCLW